MPESITIALGIFVLRVVNNAIGTVRLVALTRDRRLMAFVLGFIESVTFAVTIGAVVTNLSDIINVIAYAGGYSVGGYLGQVIEARFVNSFMTVHIITSDKGHEIAVALRDKGYGVTETQGEGSGGVVSVLRSVVRRQQLSKLLRVIKEMNSGAFVTVEEARAVHRGWIRAARNQR